jgi:ABC-2 type transport system permease protein
MKYWIPLKRGFISQLQHEYANKLWWFHTLVEPVFIAFVSVMLYQFTGASPQDYTKYVIFGSGFMGVWLMVMSFGGMSIAAERLQGTLELLFLTPVSLFSFTFGKILSSAVSGMLSLVAVFFVGKFILDLPLHVEDPLLFCVTVLLAVFTLATFGLVLASVYMLTRRVQYFMNLFQSMIYVLTGVFFPITLLPLWVRPFSYALSLTWALDAIRITVAEHAWKSSAYWLDIGMVVILTGIYIFIAVLLYQYVRKTAVRDGKLSLF